MINVRAVEVKNVAVINYFMAQILCDSSRAFRVATQNGFYSKTAGCSFSYRFFGFLGFLLIIDRIKLFLENSVDIINLDFFELNLIENKWRGIKTRN